MNIEKEIWKPVVGYEGLYEISNLGRVKSLERVVNFGNQKRTIKEKILSLHYLKRQNYVQVCITLYNKQKRKDFIISRLVATAFIPNPYNRQYIDHINTNPTDNRVENLRWVTAKENSNNPLTIEHFKKSKKGIKGIQGEKNKYSKKVLQFDLNGSLIKEWESIRQIERESGLNITHTQISRCCNGKYKTSGGYIWKFKY